MLPYQSRMALMNSSATNSKVVYNQMKIFVLIRASAIVFIPSNSFFIFVSGVCLHSMDACCHRCVSPFRVWPPLEFTKSIHSGRKLSWITTTCPINCQWCQHCTGHFQQLCTLLARSCKPWSDHLKAILSIISLSPQKFIPLFIMLTSFYLSTLLWQDFERFWTLCKMQIENCITV